MNRIARSAFVACAALGAATAWALPGRIALVQHDGDSRFGQYADNRERLRAAADLAIAHKAHIIVFPEGSSYGYASSDGHWCSSDSDMSAVGCRDVATIAEPVPAGPSTIYWETYAREHRVYVLLNLPESEGGKYYNTTVAVGPDGYVGKYRKRAMYWADALYATPGTEPYVLKTPYGNFGLLICMDVSSEGYLEAYKQPDVDAAILMMDWDENPYGPDAGKYYIALRAGVAGLDVYASDEASWDGTGKYSAAGGERERRGIPPDAVGQVGVTFHELRYR